MRRLQGWLVLCLAGLFVLALAACDSGSGGGETGDPDEGQSYSETITAAEGGTLQTASGSAVLNVPAGALSTDTELSVTIEAAESGTESAVYNFGPDGTTFAVPVTLSIAFDGNVPDGQEAVLAVKEDGSWTEIAGSSLSSGMVTGEVEHFSHFSVIFVAGEVIGDSDCDGLDTSFTACGGNPEGTWVIDFVCANLDALAGSNPLEESCPEGTVAYAVDWVGEFLIDATTVTMDLDYIEVASDWDMPLSCLAPYQIACADLVEMMGGEEQDEADCHEEGSDCLCHFMTRHVPETPEVSNYTIDGNEIVTESDGGESRSEFCVEGDAMTVKFPEDDDSGFMPTFAVFTRQ